MTSRKRLRQLFTRIVSSTADDSTRTAQQARKRRRKRESLLETLESRQMLSGPQLIGVQPNDGDLIVEGTVRNIAPRALTFRFDEVQQIDPATFSGIQITRAGTDQTFGTADDVRVVPGLVTLGDIRENEVVVRFAENLPDDKYQINVFAFDDADRGVVALRNRSGEAIMPSIAGARTEQINFELDLGALVEAVVPQPIVRLADNTLQQRRDEVLVYFNEDPLFVENNPATGLPTSRSVENPRFYQLFLTKETVSNFDDEFYRPTRVIYDQATHTARLIFASDLNTLPGVPATGGTFRLRVGSAVDQRSDFLVQPTQLAPGAVGDTITTSATVGSFTATGGVRSLMISEAISPVSFDIQLPGSLGDPGRQSIPDGVGGGLSQTLSALFGPDTTAGITEITYNFQSVFAGGSGPTDPAQLNNISDTQKRRVREALSLWATYLGVQFRETADTGITFAVGNVAALEAIGSIAPQSIPEINASLRIDPTFADSAIVFSNQTTFSTNYGEDFFRKTMAGIGFLIGLESGSDLAEQTVLALSTVFLNETVNVGQFLQPTDAFLPLNTIENLLNNAAITGQTIDRPPVNALTGLEPVFPGNQDILHGQHLYRLDGNQVDLYRFNVDLGPGIETGTLTAETFAQRLPDASLLDTTLLLFQQQQASVTRGFDQGAALNLRFDAVQPGGLGNGTRVEFIRTNRAAGDSAVRIIRPQLSGGALSPNRIIVDVPLINANVTTVPIGNIADAINSDPFAQTIVRATITTGLPTANIGNVSLSTPSVLSGGGLVQLTRNDDYTGTDSLLEIELGTGVYYLGVSSSGNESYNPAIARSGYGGTSQGRYDLLLKFEPQINAFDSIRDLDSARAGVPGTAIDGDGDGTPGGVNNFWFQTRPLDRSIKVTGNASGITARQTFTITGAGGAVQRFEFVPLDQNLNPGVAAPGNIAISYNPGAPVTSGSPTPAANLVSTIRTAINSVSSITGVRANVAANDNTVFTLTGEQSIVFSSVFTGVEIFGRTIFVDKTASVTADGSQTRPFNNIASLTQPSAFGAARQNDIVRIVGNGGQDRNISTPADNFAYQFGLRETGGGTLDDGLLMEVPRGVTVMVDAGVALKFRSSAIIVGSSNLTTDRNGGALQVLGTPRLVDLSSPVIASGIVTNRGIAPRVGSGNVVLTSTRDRAVDAAAAGNSPAPDAANWGGIIFRRDFDRAAGRSNLEDQGIFLQTVNHADIRFGGGSNILINGLQQTVNPIQTIDLRPTITFNQLTNNAGAAISASPDSFEETRYQEPRFQAAGRFTADYERVGPDIKNNRLTNNSINGLFLRTDNVNGLPPRQITVSARFDDIDIVHYIAENIVIAGRPGGSLQDGVSPDFSRVTAQPQPGGTLAAGGYQYRMTFVDAAGFESLASVSSAVATTTATNRSIQLVNLPLVPTSGDYISRRLYRLSPGSTNFSLIADLDRSTDSFIDTGAVTPGAVLDLTRAGIRGRLSASLVVDPNTVVKFRGARIELGQGSQLLAEGLPGQPVVFTSFLDDRYGAGGSFDTNNDRSAPGGGAQPLRGDWAGIYAGPTANVSIDNAVIAYGGGISALEGGQTRGFAPLELQQATGRVTNSRFEFNDDGQGGSGPIGRNGRLAINPSTIFVRSGQPTIVGNEFVDNRGPILDIDLASFTDRYVADAGRQTGPINRIADLDDNQGPLVRRNATNSVATDIAAEQQINALRIRGGVLSSTSVWDDTDIVHVLLDSVVVDNYLSGGTLTLKSRPAESLVVKLLGGGTPNSATLGTGFDITGTTTDVADRIGGTLHVLGLPGAPVIFTSLKDDTVGAGRRLDGTAQTDTNGDSFGSRPEPNDWRSLYFRSLSNDRNVAVLTEIESPTANAPGLNSTTTNPQFLGELASVLTASDDQFRLGLQVTGYLSEPSDQDVYNFTGIAGTEVFIDIDQTSFGLDSVIEILDGQGSVLARSNDSFAEFSNPGLLQVNGPTLAGRIAPLADINSPYTETWASGAYADFGSTNPRDAGFRFVLSGTSGVRSNYFLRVRSAGSNLDDISGGLSRGSYTAQIRLQETQEFPGSVVQFADIRYANHGIHLQGLPGSSPLLGEAQENEQNYNTSVSESFIFGVPFVDYNGVIDGGADSIDTTRPLGARPQYIGNLADSKSGTISVGGALATTADVDFYRVDVQYDPSLAGLQRATVFDIDFADGFNRPNTNLSVFFSPTGSALDAQLVLFGQGSNVADDLASPGAQANPTDTRVLNEILARGSITSNDPLIGPISLAQGSYFVAVTESALLPQEFADNPLVRREPIEALLRIFDDAVEPPATGATAQPPRLSSFVGSLSPGFTQTTDRGADQGHQRTGTFNGTRFSNAFPDSNRFEIETNNTFLTAMDLETGAFSLGASANIGSITTNTSQVFPHTSVRGTTFSEIVDIYRFEVAQNFATVILDIDNGFDPQQSFGFNNVDLKLQLIRPITDPVTGATTFQVVQTSNDAPATFGAGGSVPNVIPGTIFTGNSADPFIQTFLTPGVYFVAVSPEATTFDPNTGVFALDVALQPLSGSYDLHVSVEGHTFAGGDPNNASYHFDRSAATGSLQSAPFELTGYAAADLPTFYFDYFADVLPTEQVRLVARSNEQTTPVDLAVNFQAPAFGTIWRQAVVSLGQFAGNTGIVLEFQYTTDTAAITAAEGLYLDNFIVGFAERGEMIFGANLGAGAFSTGVGGGVAGQYQLEVRPGTEYVSYDDTGVNVTSSFDTNARFASQVSIVAPLASQIIDGDTFTLSDGPSTITFEFTLGTRQPAFGNVGVPYTATSTRGAIAQSMISAINSPGVRSGLNLSASTGSGVSNFATLTRPNTDFVINLHGNATGSLAPIASITDAPPVGTPLQRTGTRVQLPAVFFDDIGDTNKLRTQGQVIIDSNRISDTRAIGIWSEVGPRQTDPDDLKSITKVHLRQPPIGNSQLGAVLNLPTANSSVIGGLTAGPVIVNNVIDQAGFAGVKVDGETRPVVLEWNGDPTTYASGNTLLGSRADILIPDGYTIAIDAGGTRVVFEFDDISGAPENLGGSGTPGGDGFVDGHVPIYYRLGEGPNYNPNGPPTIRSFGYTAQELMLAILESINGSILVTNGLVQLVRPTIGPATTQATPPQNRFVRDAFGFGESFSPSTPDFANPAVYLEGVTAIYASPAFQKEGRFVAQLTVRTSDSDGRTIPTDTAFLQAPVYDSPQPLARIVNNTIYGNDGTEGSVLADGSFSPTIGFPSTAADETIAQAIDTKLSVNHNGLYTANGNLSTTADVDFYKVDLVVGDRLIADIDTLAGDATLTPPVAAGPTTTIRVFNARGIEVARSGVGALATQLKPGSTLDAPIVDIDNGRDGFVDFTATATDTYYVAISSAGNDNFDATSLTGRVNGTGGVGNYRLALDHLAPKSFVFSLDSHPLQASGIEVVAGNINGTFTNGGPAGARTLVGTTFTISQIPDYLVPTRAGDEYTRVQPDNNKVTFEFTLGISAIVLGNGNINIALRNDTAGGYRVPDIMRAIALAINGYLNNPALPNHELGNGPDGRSGPVSRVKAQALGGSYGDNLGIDTVTTRSIPGQISPTFPFPPFPGGGFDFTTGFGHDRRESLNSVSIVTDGAFNDSRGTTELYVLIERAARIELSPEAIQAGLKLSPDHSRPVNSTESDQLLTEFGVLLSAGASGAVLNNTIVNTHQSVVRDESSPFGFGGRIDTLNPDQNRKPGQVTLTGNAFQYDDERTTQIRDDLSWWINFPNVLNTNPNLKTGISTDLRTGPSNVRGGNSDFNFVVRPQGTPGQSPGNFIATTFDDILEDASGNRFTPVQNAPIVDSAVNSIQENTAFSTLKSNLGIPSGLIFSPQRDNTGQLRADDPFSNPPGGVGSDVFKDRGAVERADFVGPVAIIEFALDNDAAGIDVDPTTSFLRLTRGVYDEFRIRLSDLGDASDPFVGSGIDDDTVVAAAVDGLRAPGAAITVFENDRLLTEGIDYTFSYDTTKDTVTLRPLAGIWRSDRSYRVVLNNRDRIVGVAPAAGQISDGDTFAVLDNNGGRVTFEYDSGFQLLAPEALQFTVPSVGTGAGGIADGDLFSLIGVDGLPVLFEFNRDATQLPGTRQVRFAITDSPTQIAASARTAIAAAATAGLVDVDVDTTATGPTVVIGSDAGMVLDASRSGLVTAARTLALQIPAAGVGSAGVADGDVLTINDGNTVVAFEFDTNGQLNNLGNTPIGIGSVATADGVRDAILAAIQASALRLTPIAVDNILFLGLPTGGSATVSRGNLAPVGFSRTPADGDTIRFTPAAGPAVIFELTRDAAIVPGNVPVNFTRLNTGDQLAAAISAAIQSQSVPGLDSTAVQANPGGLVSIGGTAGLQLALNTTSTLTISGQPDVQGSTLLTIFGPLLLTLPVVGGVGIPDDSQFTLSDGTNAVTFLFNVDPSTVPNPLATPILYRTFQDVDTIAAATVAAINAAGLTVTATNLGGGLISLGPIAANQLTFPPAPAIPAPLSPRRGIVQDGELVTITQGALLRVFEFEQAIGGGGVSTPGAIPVVFQPNGTVDDVANVLAASINNNRGNLNVTATAVLGGQVRLADTPQTVTTVAAAAGTTSQPTIMITGQPGGAVAIPFTGSFTAADIKRATIAAINGAGAAGVTSLVAEDRGGATFFIENALLVDGPLANFFLEGIKDLAGNLLEPTRDDNTTQFTLLLPTIGLDFGDAPDPVAGVPGRYPTLLANDGARHVVSDVVRLGRLVDIDSDGLPTSAANGDDTTVFVIGTIGSFFQSTINNGFVEVSFNRPVNLSAADGNTITLSTGVDTATLEFDTNGLFNENNFAVAVDGTGAVSLAQIAEAFRLAVIESPLRPADVVVVGDTVRVVTADEDGVRFTSEINPSGILNRGVPTPITVTVTGGGVLEAWIDFNFDGDFTDPGEQIIDRNTAGAVFSANEAGTPVERTFIINVPATTPPPSTVQATYARFRISAEGGLAPTGLALSGEVEDYRLSILPGLPPVVDDTNRLVSYRVDEDGILQARDADGTLTPGSTNDNGALAAIRDPDGDRVAVFAADVRTSTLLDSAGATAGQLNLLSDGTFTFQPEPDFFGSTRFTFRVTDVNSANPAAQLVSPVLMTVNITIDPVNDRPFVSGAAPTTTVTIAEDAAQVFNAADLTRFFSPGPANESTQPLVIQSAGVSGFGFQTLLGGTLTIENGNIRYTPPANFPGPGPDRFTYVVADDPNDLNQLVESAATMGTVVINITAVNDAPIVGPDSLSAGEDTPLTIPFSTLLANDVAGPPDEVAANQQLTLVIGDFPKTTDRGGRIEPGPDGVSLVYRPAANFSGQDQFTYRVSDNGTPSATGTGVVFLNVGGDNDPPIFIGVNGVPGANSITLNESKDTAQVVTYNLSTWFSDPEGDSSTFTVTSSDTSVIQTQVTLDAATGISTLRLTLPPFRFSDEVLLTIVATNVMGPSATQIVPVRVLDTPDPPEVIGTLNPLVAVEDELITRDLATVFNDPDGSPLVYSVTRIGDVFNPTAAQIAASPLVNAITFPGGILTITLDPDAFGSVEIEIAANDGALQVTDRFTLTVTSADDDPRGIPDFYNVPIGARFEIIDPLRGLVGNDRDPDADVFPGTTNKIRVETSSLTQPSRGTVLVNPDGTFTYTNNGGATGDTDSFTYRPIDATGRVGNVTTVTFNLGRSRYQNPIPGFSFDVSANGVITPLDALRIVNLLARRRVNSLPVSELTTAPPDFFDVNGDGIVRLNDALIVINEIGRRNRQRLGQPEGELVDARLATTVAFAAPTTFGLAESNLLQPAEATPVAAKIDTLDPFVAGFDVLDARPERSAEELIQLTQTSESSENTQSAFDEVLSSWLEASTL